MQIGYATYKNYIRSLCERLKALFGEGVILLVVPYESVVRGQARPGSDIDLLIVHKKVDFNLTKRFVTVTFELEEETAYKHLVKQGLSPYPSRVFLTGSKLWDKPHILLDILVEGISLYDTGIPQIRFGALRKRLKVLGSKRVMVANGTWHWDLKPDWKPGEAIVL